MKFPYRFYEGRFLPIVPIRLKGKESWIEHRAYVDTGASYCLFPADVAEFLGLVLEEGEVTEMVLGDGNILKVYLHRVLVSLSEEEFTATIGFSKGLGVGFYILGTRDLFDKFKVCFNQKEKYVEFTPI